MKNKLSILSQKRDLSSRVHNDRRKTGSYKKRFISRHFKTNPNRGHLKKRKIADENRCRFHKRRPFLLSLLHSMHSNRVSKNLFWLDTHIWHVKRFFMSEMWGFKLPTRNTFRGLRFISEALKNSCVIQDVSFIRPIELMASLSDITNVLSKFLDPLIYDHLLSSHKVLLGASEYQAILFAPESFPCKCLGPVTLHFLPLAFPQPPQCHDSHWSGGVGVEGAAAAGGGVQDISWSHCRRVWIYVHPAMYDTVLEYLLAYKRQRSDDGECDGSLLECGPLQGEGGGVNRFYLAGPNTTSILSRILRPVCDDLNNYDVSDKSEPVSNKTFNKCNEESSLYFLQVIRSNALNALWKSNDIVQFWAHDSRNLKYEDGAEVSLNFCHLGDQFRSSDGETDRVIINALSRHHGDRTAAIGPLPVLRAAKPEHPYRKPRLRHPQHLYSDGGLYCSKTRQAVVERTVATAIVNRNRGERYSTLRTVPKVFEDEKWQSQPSSDLKSVAADKDANFGDPKYSRDGTSPFPVVVIRKSGDVTETQQMQWEIVVPACRGRDLWNSLIFAGANPVGVLEREHVDTELGNPSFPRDFPDAASHSAYWNEVYNLQRVQKNMRPKNRRRLPCPKFVELPKWSILFPERDDESANLVVIRNSQYTLPFIPQWAIDMHNSMDIWKSAMGRTARNDSCRNVAIQESEDIIQGSKDDVAMQLPHATLIRVRLFRTGRGYPKVGAKIFCPLPSDYESWKDHRDNRMKSTSHVIKGHCRRLGDWWGTLVDVDKSPPSLASCSGREVIGVVTSAASHVGEGYCNVIKLQQTLENAGRSIPRKGSISGLLVMYQNALSEWCRPAIIEIKFSG